MSGQEHKRQVSSTTSVTTTTETREATATPDFDVLTPEEEKVLRMLHGLSEDERHQLKFALGADDEVRLRLALMEKYLIELFAAEQLDEDLIEDLRALRQSFQQPPHS